MVQIKISEVIHDLKNGFVRYKKQDKQSTGSIQEKYGLSDSDMAVLVQHAKIKGIKTTKQSNLVIIDDTDAAVAQDIKIKKTSNKPVEPVM